MAAHAVLMTATIAPSPMMGQTSLRDPGSRAREYREALAFYLALPASIVSHVVLAENSGTDLGDFAALAEAMGARDRLELLSIVSTADPARGKGFAESALIEAALARTRVIGADQPFWKVTGRLRVLNLAAMIATAPPGFALYCDLRAVPLIGNMLGGNQWMETRLFAATPNGYDRLFGGQGGCNYVIENGFYDLVTAAIAAGEPGVVPRFAIQPLLDGVSGASGKNYRSPTYRAKEQVRSIGRRIVPGLWL